MNNPLLDTAGLPLFDRIAPAFGARAGCEFDLLGHKLILLGGFQFKKRTH